MMCLNIEEFDRYKRMYIEILDAQDLNVGENDLFDLQIAGVCQNIPFYVRVQEYFGFTF